MARGPGERVVVAVLSGAFAVETMLYSAIIPVLPYYADRFDLGKTAVGVLAALYAIGIVVGSLLGARLVGRLGPRTTAVAGFATLAVASVAFGLSDGIVLLDLVRFVQGASAGCIWAGTMAWLFLVVGDRRGGAIGGAMGIAVVGTVVGPVLGTAAVALGPSLVFTLAAVPIAVFAIVLTRLPLPSLAARRPAPPATVLRNRHVLAAAWLVFFPGMFVGGLNALVPLRLSDLGASSTAVGLVFIAASILIASLSHAVGTLADRLDPRWPAALGLALTAVFGTAMAVAASVWVLAIATVATEGLALVLVWLPAMLLLTNRAEAAGAALGLSAALVNISVALGESIGSPSSAAAAEALGSNTPVLLAFAAVAATTATCLVWPVARRWVTNPA